MKIFTIGHSTRSFEEFLRVLKAYGIKVVIDIRHFPSSRKFPWFNKENLEIELPNNGIKYFWIEELGGFRKEGYEAYMETQEWKLGINKLINIASESKTVIMCAEILWWKCHRRLVSNWLLNNKWEVIHIFNENKIQIHSLIEHKDTKVKCN